MSVLDTGIKNVKNVAGYNIGVDSILGLRDILAPVRRPGDPVIFYIDDFFMIKTR